MQVRWITVRLLESYKKQSREFRCFRSRLGIKMRRSRSVSTSWWIWGKITITCSKRKSKSVIVPPKLTTICKQITTGCYKRNSSSRNRMTHWSGIRTVRCWLRIMSCWRVCTSVNSCCRRSGKCRVRDSMATSWRGDWMAWASSSLIFARWCDRRYKLKWPRSYWRLRESTLRIRSWNYTP